MFCNLSADDPQQSDVIQDRALETDIGENADFPGFVVSCLTLQQYNNSCGK